MVHLRAESDGALLGSRPFVMGILNVTPDSFSDGGRFVGEAAVEHALSMVADGADIIDVGAESTRPGSEPVTSEEELSRLDGVLQEVVATGANVSIDTTKAEVARWALDRGAGIVNDVSACRFDAGMAPLVARRGCPVVLMHMLGMPRTMQEDPRYPDGVVREIVGFLRHRIEAVVAEGVSPDQVVIDPGIGFGKTVRHNLEVLSGLPELKALGPPLLVGASRKWFIGQVSSREVDDRLGGSIAAATVAVLGGADIVRTHEVRETVAAIRVAHAIARPGLW